MKISTRYLNALVAAIAAIVVLPSIPLRAQDNLGAPDQPPKALAQPSPSYSFDLRHDEIVGKVVVSFTVTPSGAVTNAAVVSSTHKRLEKPVLEAVKNWKFAPAVKAGAPVSSKVIQPIAFTISG
jgi:TonB family protein